MRQFFRKEVVFIIASLLLSTSFIKAQNYIEFEPYDLEPDEDGWFWSGDWISDGWNDSTFYDGCDMEYLDRHHWESGVQLDFTYNNTMIMPSCWPKNAEPDGVGSNVTQGYIQLGKTMYYGTDSATYAYVISPELKNLDSLSIQISPDVTYQEGRRVIQLDIDYSTDGGITWSADTDYPEYIILDATSKLGTTFHLDENDEDWGANFGEFVDASESGSILIRFMSTDHSYESQQSQRIKIHNIKIYADEYNAPFTLSSENSQGEITSEIIESGDSLNIFATINADSLTSKTINWTVSDESLATITSVSNTEIKLIATGNSCGTVIVSASFNDYPSISRSLKIDLSNQVPDTAVSITGVSEDTITLYIEKEMQLSAAVFPNNACDTSIVWASSNEEVVTVSNSGLITGVSVGEAIIKATSVTGFYDSVIVNCEIPGRILDTAISIYIYPTSYLPTADSIYLDEIIYPEDATYKSVTWTSSDENVATVDHFGNVLFLTEGEVVITATTKSGAYDTIVLKNPLVIPDTAVVINMGTDTTLFVGDSLQLSADVLLDHAYYKSVIWTSVYESIATISDSGLVKAVSKGQAVITASSVYGGADTIYISCIIKDTAVKISSTITEESVFSTGDSLQISAAIYPEDASDSTLSWSSSNEEVATVNNKGIVKAVSAGTTTIKVSSANNYSDSLIITIVESTTAVANSLTNSKLDIYPNPASETITISSDGDCQVKVTNLTGVTVIDKLVGANATLDVSSLKAGLYIVTLYSGSEYNTLRMIKL